MTTNHYRRRPGVLLCSLCGRELVLNEEYWACSGSVVCAACLPDFARTELAPYRELRGKETHL